MAKKYYFPDYLIAIRGIPILVVEAKKPDESLEEGYSEARLYAQEVNAKYSHNINVCQYVIACNGRMMWAGYSDQAKPFLCLSYDEFAVENENFNKLIGFCSRDKFLELANKPYVQARGSSRFASPVSVLGGQRVQNGEMTENSFGRTLVFENRAIFDPETETDRTIIVKNAYISSLKREQHIEPIYKEIRRFELPSQKNSVMISTEKPDELVDKISEKIIQNHDAYSLILIIGNVGSGKTTFTRYFKYVYLADKHPDLSSKCEWVFINMNYAPLAKDEVYKWIKNEIIESIKA